jgi:serine/threonine protein kinase
VTLFLEYIHSQDVVYRDLKPENLLLDKEGYIKVADFGCSKKIAYKSYTLCGTTPYLAPELILSAGHGKGADWWALGVVAYELLVGQTPWVDDQPLGVYQQILQGRLLFPRFFDGHAKALVKCLLTRDVTRRFGCLKVKPIDVPVRQRQDDPLAALGSNGGRNFVCV